MALSVNNNAQALNTYRNLTTTQGMVSKSLEKLSSGYRINRAADDAAGLAISEGLRSQVNGLTQASRNAQDGISVVQTAEGALNETTSILQRMRTLSVQASNDGGLNVDAKKNIQSEIGQLKSELTRIADTTSYNGTKLLSGDYNAKFQVGANAGETISVAVGTPMGALGLGVDGVDVTGVGTLTATITGAISDDQGTPTAGKALFTGDFTTAATAAAQFDTLKGSISYNGKSFDLGSVTYAAADTAAQRLTKLNTAADAALGTTGGTSFSTQTTVSLTFTGATPAAGSTAEDAARLTPVFSAQSGATEAINKLDKAIGTVSTTRANLGAVQNRLEHTINNLNVSTENLTASESRIRDTDMASEMVSFSSKQILAQAGTAMLAQAKNLPQSILSLLQG